MSRYFGILLGYLPKQGLWEFQMYEGGILSGSFTPILHSILQHDVRYYQHCIGQHCCFELDEREECIRIKLNNNFTFD
jgi:hypothetical protein